MWYSCDIISRVRLSLHIVLSAVNFGWCAFPFSASLLTDIVVSIHGGPCTRNQQPQLVLDDYCIRSWNLHHPGQYCKSSRSPLADPWCACCQRFRFPLSQALTSMVAVGSNSPTAPGCYGGLEVVVPDPSSDLWYKFVVPFSRISLGADHPPTEVIACIFNITLSSELTTLCDNQRLCCSACAGSCKTRSSWVSLGTGPPESETTHEPLVLEIRSYICY